MMSFKIKEDLNRLADLFITGNDFDALIKSMDGRTAFQQIGLPRDAEWVATYFDHTRQAFRIRYRHLSFGLVANGAEVPIIHPDFISVLPFDESDDFIIGSVG